MVKKIILGIGVLIFLLVAVTVIAAFRIKPNAKNVLEFIKENPEKCAIMLVRNGETIAELNTDKQMPVASTVKVILAIEYSLQAASDQLNPNSLVSINDLNRFYVPKTDGGAHRKWLRSAESKIENDSIQIREVAKGMIKYSSNANTEWLAAKLGLNNINDRIDSLELLKHTDFYFIVSALFVGKEVNQEAGNKELEKKLRDLKIEDYISITNKIHKKILIDTNYVKEIGDLSMNIQRVWSDNLPKSTVKDYVSIMQKINSRTYFSEKEHGYLDEVMEYILENPRNRKWLEHSGTKGGSTAFVRTKALYATDKKGNKTELAYFFENLNSKDQRKLKKSMNQFELKILTSQEFREMIQNTL